MALRVLLGDESSSIRKVMQLALQDFGIEVKSVPIGIDVIEVAKTFRPDIAFVDVLLQKRSGYDVCSDIRKTPELKNLPVVLMWSGFMDLDEKKLKEATPDDTLEKPFEASTLRDLVTRLVPRLKGNPVEQYLRFPHLPSFEGEEEQQQPAPQSSKPPAQVERAQEAAEAPPQQPPQRPQIPEVSPLASPAAPQSSDDLSGFDALEQQFANSNDQAMANDHDFGINLEDEEERTMAIGPENNTDDFAPDGFDFGEDDGFTHVPLSALKSNKTEAPEGIPQEDIPQAPKSQAPGGLQEKIKQARSQGELPRYQEEDEDDRTTPVARTPSSWESDFPQPPKSSDYDLPEYVPDENEEDLLSNSDNQDEDFQSARDLSQFKIDLPEIGVDDLPEDYDEKEKGEYGTPEYLERDSGQAPSLDFKKIAQMVQEEVTQQAPNLINRKVQEILKDELQPEQIEQSIRKVAAEAVEAAVWKLVPDIAERLVREELKKLMREIDQSVGVKE